MLDKRTSEPRVICPRCSHQIPPTESLAAPLLEAEREIHRRELDAKESDYRQRMDDIRRKEEELAQARAAIRARPACCGCGPPSPTPTRRCLRPPIDHGRGEESPVRKRDTLLLVVFWMRLSPPSMR
jgi:hypothetical protein